MNVGDAGEVRCEKDAVASSLPEGMQVLHLEQMDEGFLVQWAAVESADTLFITFKGTDNPTDVIMTVGYAQRDDKPHALSVASSMQTALDNKGGRAETTVDRISALVRSSDKPKVVLCGHSLGGGYAILAALDMVHRELPIASVVTFGAPQVVVPDPANPTWQKLNAMAVLYVNAWDIVPRLPSCDAWLNDVLPSAALSENRRLATAAKVLGYDLSGKIAHMLETLGPLKAQMKDYDIVGTLYFVSETESFAIREPFRDDRSHRRVLSLTPEPVNAIVFEHHSSASYQVILEKMASSGEDMGAAAAELQAETRQTYLAVTREHLDGEALVGKPPLFKCVDAASPFLARHRVSERAHQSHVRGVDRRLASGGDDLAHLFLRRIPTRD